MMSNDFWTLVLAVLVGNLIGFFCRILWWGMHTDDD